MKYCTRCGHELEDNDVFCRKCGHQQHTVVEESDTNEELQENTVTEYVYEYREQREEQHMFTFSEAVKSAFRKTFIFSGTASRSEFWFFILFYAICTFTIVFICEIGETATAFQDSGSEESGKSMFTVIPLAVSVFFRFILIGLEVRRVHDVGLPGWVAVIPIFGLIQMFKPSKRENNPFAVDYDINPVMTRLGKIIFVIYTLGSFAFSVKNGNANPAESLFQQREYQQQLQQDDQGFNRT